MFWDQESNGIIWTVSAIPYDDYFTYAKLLIRFLYSQEKCTYPCSCPVTDRDCADCGECPRQAGEPCSEDEPCDMRKSLICKYLHGDSEGICRGKYSHYIKACYIMFEFKVDCENYMKIEFLFFTSIWPEDSWDQKDNIFPLKF